MVFFSLHLSLLSLARNTNYDIITGIAPSLPQNTTHQLNLPITSPCHFLNVRFSVSCSVLWYFCFVPFQFRTLFHQQHKNVSLTNYNCKCFKNYFVCFCCKSTLFCHYRIRSPIRTNDIHTLTQQ